MENEFIMSLDFKFRRFVRVSPGVVFDSPIVAAHCVKENDRQVLFYGHADGTIREYMITNTGLNGQMKLIQLKAFELMPGHWATSIEVSDNYLLVTTDNALSEPKGFYLFARSGEFIEYNTELTADRRNPIIVLDQSRQEHLLLANSIGSHQLIHVHPLALLNNSATEADLRTGSLILESLGTLHFN